MTLEEIIEEIDLLVSNSLPIKVKVRFINEVQKQIYREFKFPKHHELNTIPEQVLYPLPEDCKYDQIKDVILGESRLLYDPYYFDNDEYLWQEEDGQLKISKKPTVSEKLVIYYNASPTELTENNLQTSPDFNSDHHKVLLLYGAMETALREKQYDLYKSLQEQYAISYNMAKGQLQKPRKKHTTMTRGWR